VLAEDAISGLYERGCRELEGIGVRLMLAVEIADTDIGSLTRLGLRPRLDSDPINRHHADRQGGALTD
jgi:hypothetical protein